MYFEGRTHKIDLIRYSFEWRDTSLSSLLLIDKNDGTPLEVQNKMASSLRLCFHPTDDNIEGNVVLVESPHTEGKVNVEMSPFAPLLPSRMDGLVG